MCSEGLEWDQPLEGQCLQSWKTLIDELKILQDPKMLFQERNKARAQRKFSVARAPWWGGILGAHGVNSQMVTESLQ